MAIKLPKFFETILFPYEDGNRTSLGVSGIGGVERHRYINADYIKTGTLDAARIAAGSITGTHIAATTITGDNIAASTITANKLSISTLSAITADLGTVTAGTLTGTLIRTSSGGDRVELNYSDNTLRFYSGGNLKGALYGGGLTGQIVCSGTIYTNARGLGFAACNVSQSDYFIFQVLSSGYGAIDMPNTNVLQFRNTTGGIEARLTSTIFESYNNIDLVSNYLTGCARIYGPTNYSRLIMSDGNVDGGEALEVHDYRTAAGTNIISGYYDFDIRFIADENIWTQGKLSEGGCFGWCDKGVTLANGRVVGDLEAIRQFRPHPTEKTDYGLPKIDESSLPSFIVMKPERHRTGKTITGVFPSAMISLLIGAVKELDTAVQDQRKEIEELRQRLSTGV